jgi:uncharacterized protein YbbC (DUF1343 family)
MKYSNAKLDLTFRLKYTKVLCLKSIFIFLVSSCGHGALEENKNGIVQPIDTVLQRINVGAQNLDQYLSLLLNKSVGIVGNQTSMIVQKHLVDSLLTLDVNIQRVFSPEHGFRGDADAGEKVGNSTDLKTGLEVVSLYDKNKKPQIDQLKGIDIMLFDIQDVGVRFYTYISTLHYVMEACAENNIPLIVLDRPNPNGHYVDGPVLDMDHTSFVGMHPVPIVHGMTIGEYAQMINGEGWLEDGIQCDLNVVLCTNYSHDKPYSLPIAPSPNLRSDIAIQLYPSLCLLEVTTVSVGRGTEHPFERYGHPDFPKTGFSFTPIPGYGSKSPKHNGKLCNGYKLNGSEYARKEKLDLSFVLNSYALLKGKLFNDRQQSFNLLAGNNKLILQIKSGKTENEIRKTWQTGLDQFKLVREKYLLYE